MRGLPCAALAQGEGEFAAGSGVSFHFACAKRRRLPQPGQTDLNRAPRWISLPPEDRQRAAGATFGGADRVERLSSGRSELGDSVEQYRESETSRGRVSRHSGRGKFLHGAARSRDGRTTPEIGRASCRERG